MNPISFIKRVLSIAGPQIDLVTQDSKHYPSEWIKGELHITAPDYELNVKSITINLKEFWIEYLMDGRNWANRYCQHASITIANNLLFLPRMKYQFAFAVQLPANCRVPSEGSGWRLGVVVSTSGPSISRADFSINVQLSRVLQKIIEAIEKDTHFTEVPRGRKFIFDTSATRFVFRPPEHLQSELQYFTLDVTLTDDGGIKGNILFDRKESPTHPPACRERKARLTTKNGGMP